MTIRSDFYAVNAALVADMLEALAQHNVAINVVDTKPFPDNNHVLAFRKKGSFEFATTSENTNFSAAVTYQESSVTATAVRGGAYGFLSIEAMRFRPNATFATLDAEAGRAAARWIDSLVTALFSGFSQSVGSTGADLNVATVRAAVLLLELANVPGPYNIVLHTQQAYDLQTDIISGTDNIGMAYAAPQILGLALDINRTPDGYKGSLLGIPVWASTSIPTANAGADRLGLVCNGSRAIAGGLDPQIYEMSVQNPVNFTESKGYSMFAGFVEREDVAGVGILSDA